MKKLILFAAILFSTASLVKADGPTATATDGVTLNVNLYPIQTLVVNSGQKNIDLDYKTVKDYSAGVFSNQPDHLTVYSTGGFGIKVKSANTSIKRANGAETIEASSLSVQASSGTDNPLGSTLQGASAVKLSADEQTLFSHGSGGVNLAFNVEYRGAGDNAYVNKYVKSESPTVYSTTVTYSIVAQ